MKKATTLVLLMLTVIPCCRAEDKPPAPAAVSDDELLTKKAEEQRRQIEAALLRLTKETEVEALQKKDAILAELMAEHARQVVGWKFECRRHGDFLTIFATRGGNPERPEHVSERYISEPPERAFSTTLNLGRTVEIRLKPGSPADGGGELLYYWKILRGGKEYGHSFSNYSSSHLPQLSAGESFRIDPGYPKAPHDRKSFLLELPTTTLQTTTMIYHIGNNRVKYKTRSYPRAAVDDQIIFVGIGATLFVPAGLGESVRDAILKEIAR